MDQRRKLEVPIDFYKLEGDPLGYDGPEPVKVGSSIALISKGGASYDATSDSNSETNAPTQGNVSGQIRVFLRAHPGVDLAEDEHWFILPTMAQRFFVVKQPDLRGVLPGRYPYRIEGEAR